MKKAQEILNKLKSEIGQNRKMKIYMIALLICLIAVAFTSKIPFTKQKSDKVETTDIKIDNAKLNEQLTELISKINGAGRVKVMITYDTSDENVYAKDMDEEFENKENAPVEQRIKSEYIIINGSDGEAGLKIKNVYPTVRGVAVVCDGANDPNVKGQIVSVVSALFDINSTRISVAEMAK